MATFASNTSVTPERSRAEIERLLMKFGVNEFHTFTKPNEGGEVRWLPVGRDVCYRSSDDPSP